MTNQKTIIVLAIAGILIITFVAFFPVLSNGWTSWDDNVYVTDNPVVQNITVQNLQEVFTTVFNGSYIPLTMISYMVDFQVSGFDPVIFHSTNLSIHLVNTCLMFWLAFLISNDMMTSLITAILFGIHPMRVESVAWISGRKDVVSMLFFLLSSICYLGYDKNDRRSLLLLSILFFLFSILSKVIVLTFPLLLILYDYYRERSLTRKIIIEKIPYAIISLIFTVIGYVGQENVHAVRKVQSFSENMIVSAHGVIFYLEKFLFPIKLSNVYPYPSTLPLVFYLYSLYFILLCVTIWKYRRRKTLVFGFLFFIISLIPVLQLVRFSSIFAADRFTYFAYIGLFYIVGVSFSKAWSSLNKRMVATIGIIVILTFSFLTWERTAVWKNNDTLWKDMLKKYPDGLEQR